MPSLTQKERDSLLQSAIDAKALSYSPYSHFRVGASVLLHDGTLVQGANVENASYGAGICAERTALLTATATSFGLNTARTPSDSDSSPLSGSIKAIAVSSDLPDQPCSPCGICRQFIREFAALDTPIFMVWKQWKAGSIVGEVDATSTSAARGRGEGCHDEVGVVVKTLEELLPLSFGPDQLNK